VTGTEVCDDAGAGGCSLNCLAVNTGKTCSTAGTYQTPTSGCSCLPGYFQILANPNPCQTVCQDGLRAGTEACDDGAGDIGCLADCSGPASFFTCSGGTSTTIDTCSCNIGYSRPAINTACTLTCFNNQVEVGETCDDNGIGGCLPGCMGVKANFSCTAGSVSTPSVCTCQPGYVLFPLPSYQCLTVCQDGLRAGAEACDDGAGDIGCLADCSGPASSFSCTGGTPTTIDTCTCIAGSSRTGVGLPCIPLCPNGVLNPGEGCDDNNGGGCLPDCSGVLANRTITFAGTLLLPTIVQCSTGYGPGPVAVCNPIQNDGRVVGNEVCDDGALLGCRSDSAGPNTGF
jgi:large repetitive protein